MLKIPEVIVTLLLLNNVSSDGNVYDGTSCCTWREKKRRKLDEMGTFTQKDLEEMKGEELGVNQSYAFGFKQ